MLIRTSDSGASRAAATRPQPLFWPDWIRHAPKHSAGSFVGRNASAPMREDALADVGLAWPELRRMLAEVGRRLQRAGVINEPDDVFWLHRSEIDEESRQPR